MIRFQFSVLYLVFEIVVPSRIFKVILFYYIYGLLYYPTISVGLYLGVRYVNLTPAKKMKTMQPMLVIQYDDGEICWFQRLVEKELWFYRPAHSGTQELSSIINRKIWKKTRDEAQQIGRSMAINLVKMTVCYFVI